MSVHSDQSELDPLLRIFHAAVHAVSGDASVERALQGQIDDQVFLVAVGKAAAAMTEGALRVLGDHLIDGLVITKYDHLSDEIHTRKRLRCIESAHPVPDQNSLQAGQSLKDYLRKLPASAELVFLTSGGTSALVEALPAGVSLQDLMRVNEYLLASGYSIGEMNYIRKSLSEIKGGRLAKSLRNRKTLQLLISDVPGDELGAIGSGLLIPPHNDPALALDLPQWLRDLQQLNCEAPAAQDPVWSSIDTKIVASNAIACAAAADYARAQGLRVCLENGQLDEDVDVAAKHISDVLKDPDSGPGVYIWGGETTVKLPAKPGRGGRNQHMTLRLASNLADMPGWQILCCGTDGSDGPTSDAGGMLSDQQFVDTLRSGLDAEASLASADAGSFLDQAQALVTTGPTGTNVMDLVIVRKN